MSARPGFVLLLLLMLGAGAAVMVRNRAAAPANPCTDPLAWRVGDVDPRFDLSEVEFRQAIEEAIWVWETAAGRQLFRYDPEGDMVVDLVHDERTSTYDRQRELQAELDHLQESVEWHRSNVDRLTARLHADSATYWRQRTTETAARYQNSVDQFNRGVDLYNAAVRRHNETLQALEDAGPSDLSVGSLHSESQIRGGRATETRRTVTVAYVGTHSELVLILTHELGHALGIGHVDADGAVMAESYRHDQLEYPVQLESADLDALLRLCREPSD